MAREPKSPALKILWLWTLGTAAILVTHVVRTRLRDMENLMNAQDQPTPSPDITLIDPSTPPSDDVVSDHKS